MNRQIPTPQQTAGRGRDANIWLADRWYDAIARERLRQVALWHPGPVLIHKNCGLPFQVDPDLETEIRLFQREGVIQFWGFDHEPAYVGALGTFGRGPDETISRESYGEVQRFVESRMEAVEPDPSALGFKNREGFLLEQVVLRRRFFAQALAGVLGARGIAHHPKHLELYPRQRTLYQQLPDVLETFFSAVGVPTVLMFSPEDFLEFRRKAQRVLVPVVQDLYETLTRLGFESGEAYTEATNRLAAVLRHEMITLVRRSRARGARLSYDRFTEGRMTEVSSNLALFYLAEPLEALRPWFEVDSEGRCRLALFLLQWNWDPLSLAVP
jgi:hypothetical protein